MSVTAIEAEGFAELSRSVALIGPELRKELRAGLVEGGTLVSKTAQGIAQAEGLEQSGALIRDIGVSVTGLLATDNANPVVRVVETARHVTPKFPQGYTYPGVYEYSAARSRPFLNPALDQDKAEVEALIFQRVNALLTRTLDTAGGTP